MINLEEDWYRESAWLGLLTPLSFFFGIASRFRRRQYQQGKKAVYKASVPVVIVGNITVGGTGKTPLIVYLAQLLGHAGYKPGIVSRGYLSQAPEYPFVVKENSRPKHAGDEALLLVKNTGCPLVIDSDRVQAVKKLENDFDCDVILSDDGLQHYALDRDIEIAVVDAKRGFGNGRLLPAGPLREAVSRLDEVDFVISNGQGEVNLPEVTKNMSLTPRCLCNLKTGEQVSLEDILARNEEQRQKVHAVAGIGNPVRFFTSLCECGFDIISHIFQDHHPYDRDDIYFGDDLDVVMTEKDAVKCERFAGERHWFLKVAATLDEGFMEDFLLKLKSSTEQRL